MPSRTVVVFPFYLLSVFNRPFLSSSGPLYCIKTRLSAQPFIWKGFFIPCSFSQERLCTFLKEGVCGSRKWHILCTLMTSCLTKGFIAATISLKRNVNLPKIVNNDLVIAWVGHIFVIPSLTGYFFHWQIASSVFFNSVPFQFYSWCWKNKTIYYIVLHSVMLCHVAQH